MCFKRLLWTPMLSKTKNGIELARLYQALCYYVSSIEDNDYSFDELANKWIDIADDVYYQLSLIDRGLTDDVNDEYLSDIRLQLSSTDEYSNSEPTELEQLRIHIMKIVRNERYQQMPVYAR